MSSFDEREKGFEQKYKHDKELEFKVNARRNKLLGLWAAEQLGLPADQREDYAKTVVMADFAKPGDSDVLEKVLGDLKAKGIEMSEHRLRRHMDELHQTAREQVLRERAGG